MSIGRVVTFRPDEELLEGMESLKERDGMPYSEQIRRGLRLLLQSRGVALKNAAPRRAGTRRKA